jgi:hypothetical protein
MFSKIWKFLKKVFGGAPTWIEQVSNVITLITPPLKAIVTIAADADDAAQIMSITAEVTKDLRTVTSILAATKGDADAMAKVSQILAAIITNLSPLLTATHIKNEVTRSKIQAYASAIVDELNAVIEVINKNK